MRFYRISILGFLFIALTLVMSNNVKAQSSASLDRMVSQIETLFPPLEGYVIAVEGSGLTLDLKQGMSVEPGDRLKLIRYGRELFHPVTKKKVGRKETDLGEVEVLEVRKDFSRARALDPTVLPKEGDGVRSPFQKLSFLVAPPKINSKKKVNGDRLRFNLESRLKKHPRFDVPSFDLGLWMIDKKLNIRSMLKSRNLEKLISEVKANFILIPSIRSVNGKMALNYKLVSAIDGTLKKQADIMSANLPTEDDPKENRRRRKQTRFDRKTGSFKFVGKHEFSREIVDFDIGDLNGDGKDEIIAIDRFRVMIFQNKKGYLTRIIQFKTRKNIDHFLAVDVEDINGNGRDEIFVTNQVGDKLESFALEIKPKRKKLKYVWEKVNLYFRILRPIGKKPVLVSQSPGFENPFIGPIKNVFFKNGKYRQGRKLNTPDIYGKHFILYGLTQQDLGGNGTTDTIVLDKKYKLRVYSPNGRLIVKSGDYYGHDPRLVDVGLAKEVTGIYNGTPVRFKGRLQFVKVGEDRYLVIPKNKTVGDGLLNDLVVVESSGLALLRLTGEGFEKAFESSYQKGFMASSRVVPYKNGKGARVYTLRTEQSLLSNTKGSTFSTYEWPIQ